MSACTRLHVCVQSLNWKKTRICCRTLARQHTILDVIRILQSSLDPVFCAKLCIVEILICFCLSVRPSVRRRLSVRRLSRKMSSFRGNFAISKLVNLENEGCVRTIFCAARACTSMCSGFYTSFCFSAGTISRQIFSCVGNNIWMCTNKTSK